MRSSNIKTLPWCPFCGQNVGKPQEPERRKMGEFSVGNCECGAVYTCDPTGFNVGAAMVEAMVFACNDDWDMAWELIPEEDYLTGRIENYDEQTHQVVETKNLDGRKIKGVLFFVRLHKDFAEIARRVDKKGKKIEQPKSALTIPEIEPERDPNRTKKRADKRAVKKMVEGRDIDGLVDLVFDDIRALRFMQRLLYTPDDNFRWQTAHVLGKVCARLSTRKPGKVSDLLHRMFASCSDSASSSWGAVEAIGAIIGERPDIFGAFARHLLQYLDDETLRIPVLWAIGTIAEQRPDLVRNMPFYNLFTFLDHPSPDVRGHAIRLFGFIKAKEIRKAIKELARDDSLLTIYEQGKPHQFKVSQLAEQAINRIDKNGV